MNKKINCRREISRNTHRHTHTRNNETKQQQITHIQHGFGMKQKWPEKKQTDLTNQPTNIQFQASNKIYTQWPNERTNE